MTVDKQIIDAAYGLGFELSNEELSNEKLYLEAQEYLLKELYG